MVSGMCQLCDEARRKSRMRLTDTHIVLVFEGYDFIGFDKKLFEGTPINKYEELIEKFLKGPNEWRQKMVEVAGPGSDLNSGPVALTRKETKE